MALDASTARSIPGLGRGVQLRVFVVAMAIVITWSLVAAAFPGAFGNAHVEAQSGVAASETTTEGGGAGADSLPPLPQGVDGDGDTWIDTIELGLGSDATAAGSTPETISIPATCWDGEDNDGDGTTDDEDPGCEAGPLFQDAFPPAGIDTFESTISLEGYELATLLGVCAVDFSGTGPVVIERGEASVGSDDGEREFTTEMVSMQLQGTAALLPGSPCNRGDVPTTFEAILIEDPDKASTGSVASQPLDGAADFPADSFFDIFFEVNTPLGLLPGGPPGGPSGDPVRVSNVVNSMPPYHSPANADLNPDCYEVERAGHVHCPKPPLDHFLCYSGDFPERAVGEVLLADQFGPARSSIGRADRFCNATSKNSMAIADEGAHLHRFTFSGDEAASAPRRVLVTNQFGPQELAVGQPVGLFVPSRKNFEVPPAALDHFRCYRVEGVAPGRAVTLADQFSEGAVRSGTLGLPLTLCNPTTKTHDGIVTPVADPQWHLVCYAIESDAGADRTVRIANQFVDYRAALDRPVELCAPSMKRVLADKDEPPPKRHANLPGTALYWKVGGYKGFPASFDVPFVFKSSQPCTYDKLDFRKVQKNRLVASGPGWAAYRDTSKGFDELTVLFRDGSGNVVGVIVTGPGKLLPGNKRLSGILEALAPSLLESLGSTADHKMPAGLVRMLGLKGEYGVYYGEYRFKNAKKAKAEMDDFFGGLASGGEVAEADTG